MTLHAGSSAFLEWQYDQHLSEQIAGIARIRRPEYGAAETFAERTGRTKRSDRRWMRPKREAEAPGRLPFGYSAGLGVAEE